MTFLLLKAITALTLEVVISVASNSLPVISLYHFENSASSIVARYSVARLTSLLVRGSILLNNSFLGTQLISII